MGKESALVIKQGRGGQKLTNKHTSKRDSRYGLRTETDWELKGN